MSLSQNIKALRLKNNFTQEQLAEILGVSPQAVSKWETSETYPDGTLLVPLAKALSTSLDELFDNDSIDMASISSQIIKMFKQIPWDERFEAARDICWQIEKGMIGMVKCDEPYHPDEYKCVENPSYILSDVGFTIVSNGQSPFFAVFPEPQDSFAETVGDGEEMRRLCKCLASPETMRAVIFLHKNKEGLLFDADFLAKECSINSDDIGRVTEDLCEIGIVTKEDVKINGKPYTLYLSAPSHKLIAIFIMVHEMNYRGGYTMQAHCRNIPYLR